MRQEGTGLCANRLLCLLKIPSGLCNLGFTSSHPHTPRFILTCRSAYPRGVPGVHPPNRPSPRSCPLSEPVAPGSGKSRPPSAARHPPPQGAPTQVTPCRPGFLGEPGAGLGPVALSPHPRQAGDRPPLAPPRISILLEMEVEGPAVRQSGTHPADSSDVPREPALGRPAHPFGAPAPRLRRRRSDGGQVHEPTGQTASLTDLAYLSSESPPHHGSLRLLRGPHRHLPAALRLRDSLP